MPDEHCAHALDHRPRADLGGGRDRAARIRNLVALAIRPEAPGVIRAADRIAFEGAVLRHIRRAASCEIRAHVRALTIEQDHSELRRAPCRERVGKYVQILVAGGYLKKKNINKT